MNRYIKLILITIILISYSSVKAAAEEETVNKELYFTYIGPVIGFGYNYIKYSDWFGTERDTQKLSGIYFSGGCAFNLYTSFLVGDFKLQYVFNKNENYPVLHLVFSASGKYLWKITSLFSIAAGLGIYLETPPSNKNYKGSAGFLLPAGIIFDTTFNTKLVVDIIGRYGFYGLGEDSTKVSFGINAGFLFKVGRI